MALKLSKTNTSPYSYLSEGDGSNPVSVSVTLDGTGGTKDTNVATLYLVATQYRYTNISLTFINEQSLIDWKISLNGSTWADTVNPADMNALSATQIIPIYVKAVVTDNGTLSTGIYTTPDIRVQAIENPE